jgi:hypothetical protein
MKPTSGEQRVHFPAAAGDLRRAPGFVRVLCLFGLLGGVWLFAKGGNTTAKLHWPDFEFFYAAGTSLLERGTIDPGYDVTPAGRVEVRGRLDWYLPFTSRLMTLLAWLPQTRAARVWLAFNLVCMLALVRLVGRHFAGLPPSDWAVTQLLPMLALGLFWYWEFRLIQIDNLTLLLMVGSFVSWRQGDTKAAGLWLGLAVLIKVVPLLLVGWFVLKRQFRTVAVALATVVLAGPLADAVIFGPAGAWDIYRSWAHTVMHDASHAGLIAAEREMDWRNQGLGAVACRWLHPTDYNTRFDNDPRQTPSREKLMLNVAKLSHQQVVRIVLAVQALLLVGLIWLARRPAARLGPWALRLEWALFMTAMLWFMPVMRSYHMIWAYPLVAVLAGAIHHHGVAHWWSLIAWLALIGVVASQLTAFWMESGAGGAILGGALALGVAAVLLRARVGSMEWRVVSGEWRVGQGDHDHLGG